MLPKEKNMYITLIGDSHNNFDGWRSIVDYESSSPTKAAKTIQLGDFGHYSFKTETNAWLRLDESNVDSNNHKILGGNHDDYNIYPNSPYSLGDYGVTEDGIYYVRGAYSINKPGLVDRIEWFQEEELSTAQQFAAFDLYRKTKPKVVISHDCPTEILSFLKREMVYDNTSTRNMLQWMLGDHIPDLWVFGHHYVSRSFVYRSCEFVCLAELETKTINMCNGELV
jgi:hypothetical protein